MKSLLIILLFAMFFANTSQAQTNELIKSGEIIKEAITLSDSGQYKAALKLFDKVNRNDTNYVLAVYEKANTCFADSQFTKAITYSREGLALKTARNYEPELYNILGNALDGNNEHDEAIKVYDKGIAKYPAYSLLYFNKALVYMNTEQYAEAEKWLQKTLLINPYLYSAHFRLALAELLQGKIVPAYLSAMGYLLISPGGRYRQNAINILSQISNSTDEVLEFKNGRKVFPNNNYQETEDILLSKIALNQSYKPIISFDDPISRQMQAVIEKLQYADNDDDFWIQYYLPYYKSAFTCGKFESLVFQMFKYVEIKAVTDYARKNKKLQETYEGEVADYFNQIRATREIVFKKRASVKERYYFDDGVLIGSGTLAKDGKLVVGPWIGLYAGGNIKSKGVYDAAGKRTGNWVWYFEDGALKAKERYANGEVDGLQEYYHANGNPSSYEKYVAGQLNGESTVFYYGGNVKSTTNYKAGKKDGAYKRYYANGNLYSTLIYVNDVLNGEAREYHKNGKQKLITNYLGGKLEGQYKTFDSDGKLSSEGVCAKDKAEGEWKLYYPSAKLKEKGTYANGDKTGIYEEYFENGQTEALYNFVKGKLQGEIQLFYNDGKVLSKQIYKNGALTSARYFDRQGKVISSSVNKNGLTYLTAFNRHGIKSSSYSLNSEGELTGADTLYYPSGRIKEISVYKDGATNGPVVSYHENGEKKSTFEMTAGKKHGYYTSYYTNGKIESEGWWQDDMGQGQWLFYNTNGDLTSKTYYLDDELHGYREEFTAGKKLVEQKYDYGWLELIKHFDTEGKTIAADSFAKGSGVYRLLYANGKTMAEGNYKNGYLNGVYKSYYFDGKPELVCFYKNGELDSTYNSYYYSGIKYVDAHYTNGDKTGTWTYYDEDGKLLRRSNYTNSLLNGERITYYPNGNKDVVSLYKNDELNGTIRKYDATGNLAYELLFEDDLPVSYTYSGADGKLLPAIPINNNVKLKAYYANGKLSREWLYMGSVKVGPDVIYYSNGQKLSEEILDYDVTEGPDKAYYENGKLKYDYNYISNNAHGLCREYHENGNLKKESTFKNGVLDGQVKYYNENGKLIKTMIYNMDTLTAVNNEK